MERGNLSSRCEGKTSSGEPDKRESTDAGHRGGSARSSAEVPVMGMERRGRRIHNGPEANWKRDEPRGQMECCYASQEATAAWNTKSRMMGDYQVRFRERLGVKFPRPTRPTLLALYLWARRALVRSHSLTPLSHNALASEPAYCLVAGSLYRLGQRRRWASVYENRQEAFLIIRSTTIKCLSRKARYSVIFFSWFLLSRK